MSKKQDCYHAGARALASIVAALVCLYWMDLNQGTSGIGWFILSLFFIW